MVLSQTIKHMLQLAFRRVDSSPPKSSHIQEKISTQAPSDSLSAASTQNAVAPLPLWQRLGPVTRVAQAYGRSQQKRPYVTQTISSVFIFFCADLTAQSMNDDDYDSVRTVRNVLIGAGTAIPAYRWFLFLGKNFNYASRALSLGVKVVVNQLIFSTCTNVYFFSMQALLSGEGVDGAVRRVRDTLARSWINSCKVWPFVMAFNISFVPLEYRALFAGVVNLGWQAYLSLLNRWAEIREAEAADSVGEPVALARAA
ncbi:mpv17 pmp22 family [Trichoderma cornu-damae]|uniref:Mpv17 pmp22 family n=1 Tax=Trichoderma cornu-damae TaxID=654480 RepID=A0A9P8QNM7_9HYPO|nr:mpv17 pmp22 family [Trichoderma cornu-damae]